MQQDTTSSPNSIKPVVVGIPKRSIKFRAWHDDFGEMVYSSNNWEFGKREFTPFLFDVGFSNYPESENWKIMQFTGLKDCKGNDIYEGDIIEFDKREWGGDDNIHLVTWHEKEGEWSWGGGASSDMGWRTVIGNVFQNPEQLG